MKAMKGCIFPSGSAVTNEIVSSLQYCKNIEYIGVNSTCHNEYATLLKTNYSDCPPYTDAVSCIDYLLRICEIEECNFIIPTMDSSHYLLSKYESRFTDKQIRVISSSFETNQLCLSKKMTYSRLHDIIKCPFVYEYPSSSDEWNPFDFPVFIKPDIGYGSKHCKVVHSMDELNKSYSSDSLVLEYLTGDEFTIDCFTANGKLMYVGVRQRVLYKNGLSIITKMSDVASPEYDSIYNIATKIHNAIPFRGAWFFQLKYDKENKLTLLEISTRIAGASSINRLNGCNLVLLSILMHFGNPIAISSNNISDTVYKLHRNKVDDSVLLRYENVYVDLDDTLIVANAVNTKVLSFLYKCRNYDINVFLITRHRHDILETLKRFCICADVFNGGIIHITNESDKKSDFIKDHSIFIDDSFRERNFHKENVLVLDVDGTEFFI